MTRKAVATIGGIIMLASFPILTGLSSLVASSCGGDIPPSSESAEPSDSASSPPWAGWNAYNYVGTWGNPSGTIVAISRPGISGTPSSSPVTGTMAISLLSPPADGGVSQYSGGSISASSTDYISGTTPVQCTTNYGIEGNEAFEQSTFCTIPNSPLDDGGLFTSGVVTSDMHSLTLSRDMKTLALQASATLISDALCQETTSVTYQRQ